MGILSLARPLRTISDPLLTRIRRWFREIQLSLGGVALRRRRRAQHLARELVAELHRQGFSRRTAGRKRKVRLQRVQFLPPLLLTHDELWCPLDLAHLPTGVHTNELRDEDVLRSIEDRLHTSVRVDQLATGQLAFVIRLGGTSFPESFSINTFKLPSDAPPLAFPLGIDGEGEHRWSDLARLPHLLVVGPTGKGKSTFIHALLSTWISRNSHNDIEIWLADHKGGVELNRYKDVMGTRGRPGIVRRLSYQPAETIEMLQAALKELERRNEVLRQSDCSDLRDYARSTGQYLRPIAIVIDEIFFLMLNKERIDPEPGKKGGGMTIAQWAEHLFAKIASAGRAAGIHLIIATQRTGKDVLTPLITANFETRLVFGLADMYQSIYVIGDSSAVGLPRGRVMFREEGGQTSEIQTPLIKADQTRLLISRIARYGPDGGLGKEDEARKFCEDAKLLLTVSCEEFEGKFAFAQMWQHPRIRGAVLKDRVEDIARRLQKDGVLTAGGPRNPRRVATAFFGRPQLLEALYGPNQQQHTSDEMPRTFGQEPISPGRSSDETGDHGGIEGVIITSEPHQDASDVSDHTSDVRTIIIDHAPVMS